MISLRHSVDHTPFDAERVDALHCESITREHARTFALASTFLSAPKRRGAFAVYAFCRIADDIVDRHRGESTSLLAEELARYRMRVDAALNGQPDGPVMRELVRAVRRFGVPRAALDELLAGVARDLTPPQYATWAELSTYCEGVAASVGTMCAHIFGVPGGLGARERALPYARTLGVAMQLTNILRDVGEDAANGRVYLPTETLAQFGFSPAQVLNSPEIRFDPNWTALMRQEIARARALYRAAAPGLSLLDRDAQRCARTCADGYAAILDAIEQNGYDTFSRRARVGSWRKASLLLQALWSA